MENQPMNEQLTPEELEARRLEMKDFYEKSLPFLESQSKYEKLLTEIEEARYKRATMQIQYANIVAATQQPEEDDEDDYPTQAPPRPVAKAPAEGKKLKRN
jgi:threonyl-tRNA synthetase